MNRRLAAILDEIQDGTGVIDVGTDHGYLPAALAKRGYPGNIIAADINEGPLNRAKENIKNCHYENEIETRLSDGFEKLMFGEADIAVIAGMGGELMKSLLMNMNSLMLLNKRFQN